MSTTNSGNPEPSLLAEPESLEAAKQRWNRLIGLNSTVDGWGHLVLDPCQQAAVGRDPHLLDLWGTPVLSRQRAEDGGEHAARLDGAELPGAVGPDLLGFSDRIVRHRPFPWTSFVSASFYGFSRPAAPRRLPAEVADTASASVTNNTTHRGPAMSTQNEIRSRITDQIIAALSDPTKLPPWRKSWSGDLNSGHPCNAVSQRHYTGINPLLLEIVAHWHGLRSKWWGTFRQWEELGGRVKKRPADVSLGKWGTQIIFCKPVTKKTTDATGEEAEDKFWVLRTYTVFNFDQVDGPFDHRRVGNVPLPANEVEQRHERAETVIRATGARIHHGGNRAFYSPTDDSITLPYRHQFDRIEGYYQTAGHELCHWTEHPSRLNWDRTKPENSYALGELIAEMGGCYLMGELGLPTGEDLTNHAAYLKHWLAGLQNDARFIFRAAAAASRAVDHILSYSRTEEPVPRDRRGARHLMLEAGGADRLPLPLYSPPFPAAIDPTSGHRLNHRPHGATGRERPR